MQILCRSPYNVVPLWLLQVEVAVRVLQQELLWNVQLLQRILSMLSQLLPIYSSYMDSVLYETY